MCSKQKLTKLKNGLEKLHHNIRNNNNLPINEQYLTKKRATSLNRDNLNTNLKTTFTNLRKRNSRPKNKFGKRSGIKAMMMRTHYLTKKSAWMLNAERPEQMNM